MASVLKEVVMHDAGNYQNQFFCLNQGFPPFKVSTILYVNIVHEMLLDIT